MKLTVEKITPRKAEEYLKANTDNFRKTIDRARVAVYAKDMANGKWENNGETIKFNGKGVLMDGQHRLKAIVRSQTTITCAVARGVRSTVLNIDRGKPRSIGQYLTHQGYKNTTTLAAASRYIMRYQAGAWAIQTSPRFSDTEIVTFVEENIERIQMAISAANKAKGYVPTSQLSAILFVACEGADPMDTDIGQYFITRLVSGVGLTETDALLHLRNILSNKNTTTSLSTEARRMILTKAWNMTVKGEACSARDLKFRMSGPNQTERPGKIFTVSEADD